MKKLLFFNLSLLAFLAFNACTGHGNIKDLKNVVTTNVSDSSGVRYIVVCDTVDSLVGVADPDGNILIPVKYHDLNEAGLNADESKSIQIKDGKIIANGDTLNIPTPTAAAPKEEVKAEKEETYSDLQLLDLKGNVASLRDGSLRSPLGGTTYTFDENGMIVTIDGKKPKMKRDEQGRLIKCTFKDTDDIGEEYTWYTELKYNKDGKLASWFVSTPSDEWVTEVRYNQEGRIVGYCIPDGIEGRINITLKNINVDSNQNWTYRQVEEAGEGEKPYHREKEKRVIKYRE